MDATTGALGMVADYFRFDFEYLLARGLPLEVIAGKKRECRQLIMRFDDGS
jgi:hypothetical protein